MEIIHEKGATNERRNMNENQDLLDLCKLNLMEENVENSPAPDRGITLEAIDWKKRQLVTKLINNAPTIEPEVMGTHINTNTVNGTYLGDE